MQLGILAEHHPEASSLLRKHDRKLKLQSPSNWKPFPEEDGAGYFEGRRLLSRRGDPEITLPYFHFALVDLDNDFRFRRRATLHFSVRSEYVRAGQPGTGELDHLAACHRAGPIRSSRFPSRTRIRSNGQIPGKHLHCRLALPERSGTFRVCLFRYGDRVNLRSDQSSG